MSFDSLLRLWHTDPETAPNFAVWRTTPARPARTHPFPDDLPDLLRSALSQRGIDSLYVHQLEAWTHIRAGRNIVLATGTASGKTLAYNLPVIASLLSNPEARALYLFPTKALAQDQLAALHPLQARIQNLKPAIYDGDTPPSHRAAIRGSARILLSNPDMLHTGILPHHTNWSDFFRNLRFVVIDEMHTYRGVFGSHVANVIRRLKRVSRFYGGSPQFILTSATIGNPKELAERLIESPAELIDHDGSSRGERHFLLYNPPVVDESLGLRKSSVLEGVRLTQDLLANHIQSVVFARSRRGVEMILTYLQTPPDPHPPSATSKNLGRAGEGPIRGYRSGYLPSQRREIEQGLREGRVRAVVATNALELGIDIGGLGAAVLVGYPGSIASVYQQSGRAGRGEAPALAMLVASANPLDQFLAHHPDYFFGQSPEQGLVNPDHLLILLNHLRCAMFELPFQKGEAFGSLAADRVGEFLDVLAANHEAHLSQETYFWMSDAYPAVGVSLRTASPENVVLQTTPTADHAPQIIGEVDLASAYWMVHPHAIYIHEGQQYFVHELNLEKNVAALTAVALDYYTESQSETEIQILSESEKSQITGGEKGWGEIQVTTHVVGFKKLRWLTRENLGEEPLDLPPTEMQTTGYWISLSEASVEALRELGAWTNDPNDYGPDWPRLRHAVRTRDGFLCQVCGSPESGREHDVHHKIPFKAFSSAAEANRLDNLVTLCASCHRKAEQNVRIRSGLAGLSYALSQLAPLFLMCDPSDLGVHTDAAGTILAHPAIVIYDQVPAGIGFSQKLFEIHDELMARTLELVSECGCEDGCPSCVGPGGENGYGGKQETIAILKELGRND
ncbi:MAG TPA: DEAD/DEAH box helicase [Anaerolineales bacterium]|nr:DEAD/DEAH box helicase [Anaerolineales bacterium]